MIRDIILIAILILKVTQVDLHLSENVFYDKFKAILQSLQNGNIIDDINHTKADILRYHFGLSNEDKYLNTTQLLTKYGYRTEQHMVETEDGFILQMVRIPGSKASVLLVHGIVANADVYITSGPDQALAYALADEGYDVWLCNTRATAYSMKHVKYSPKDKEYWNFSFHEVGIYDLPAFIDFTLKKSNVSQLYYVGHSAGTTASYVLLSEKPQYNSKIELLISMAPIAWVNHLKSPITRALVPFRNEEFFIFNVLGVYDLVSDSKFVRIVREVLCGTSLTAGIVCSNAVGFISGFDMAQVNFTNYPVQLSHLPGSGTSTKYFYHYWQEIPRSEQFQQFSYGSATNLKIYGSIRPPRYDVSKITTKVALFYSNNDFMSSEIDVRKLASQLPNLVFYYKVPYPFSHNQYLFAKDAKKLVYHHIIELLKKYPI